MEKSEAAAYLAGAKQVEGAEASAPTNLHVISGEVVEKSENGKVKVDLGGIVYNGDDDQHIEIDTLGGLEVGDTATILLSGQEHRGMTPLGVGGVGTVDRIVERVSSIEADYVKTDVLEAQIANIDTLIADKADVDDLTAATARIDTLETTSAKVTDLEAATARIGELEVDHVSVDAFTAEQAKITNLQTATADIDTIRANSAKVANLTAQELEADHATIGNLDATYATIDSLDAEQARVDNLLAGKASVSDLTAANGRIDNLQSTKADISVLESDYITADTIDATYLHADMSNADVAWIQNGVIKDGSISNAMINSVSANKLTAGTINGEVINVTNLNANNITAGTINGQRIGEGSLSLDKLSEDVYTEQEVDNKLATMQAEIDGAIETWTGTAVPTLQNAPAVNWNTNAIKDTHVGDVYFVVNSQSEQNGYNYRFTKSGSTYSWQLIKDSDVTNALARLSTAEGKITTFDSDISTLKTDTGTLKTRTTNLETRMSDAEDDILDKVDTTTFNELSSTVDENSASISTFSTVISNNGLTENTNITSTVNTVSQTATGNSSKLSQLTTTLGTNADGTTKEGDIVHRTSAVEQDLSGFKTTVSNTYATKTALSGVETTANNANGKSVAYSATSSTGASTAAKVASCANFPTLVAGTTVTVRFSAANTSTGAITLNVNSTGAKTIYVNGAATSSTNQLLWSTNANITFTYDGTYWRVVSEPRTWYGACSTAAATAAKASTINEVVICKGTSVTLNMTYDNTSTSATLNITSTGAKNIYYGTTSTRPTTENGYGWTSASTVTLVFDGAYWRIGDTSALKGLATVNSTVSQHTTLIEQNSEAIAAKANASDVYTTTQVDGLITTEVNNRNAAIEASADSITTSVSSNYATKTALETVDGKVSSLTTRVSTAETNITQNTNDISLRATKTEAAQMAQPNLTPYFSMPMTQTTDDYWANITFARFTQLDDGWAHFECDNNAGSSTVNSYIAPKIINTLKAGGRYTLLVEFRNASISKTGGSFYTQQQANSQVWGTAAYGGMAIANADIMALEDGAGSFWKPITLLTEDSKDITGTVRGTLPKTSFMYINQQTSSGQSISYDIRMSLYEGEYEGPYKPYVGSQLYASQAELKVTADGITSTVSKIGGIKQLVCKYANTLPNIKTWSTHDTVQTYTVESTEDVRVGDTVYLKDTDSTRNCTVYIKGVVTAVPSTTSITIKGRGYEDALPSNSAISSINQSAETVKIQASRVEIDGTAVFSAISSDVDDAITDKGYQTASQVNTAITSKGYATTTQAQGYVTTAIDNLEIGGKNLLGNTENMSGSTIVANSAAASTFGSIGNYNDAVSLYSLVDYDGYSNAVSCATSTSTGNRGAGWYTKAGEIRAGETYTFSCRIKCSIAANVHMHTAWRNGSATAGYVGWTSTGTKAITANTWTDYSCTFVPSSSAKLDWEFFVAICITGSSSGATYQIAHAKLEKGNKPTDWSPAPEDLQSNAVKRTQRIWYRKSASGAPATPGTASSNWVVKDDDGSNAWTKMHIAISSTEKFIYTCEQYEMGDGTVGYTSVLLDNTITVIDGGNIITGSVTANKLNASNINASKVLTVGAMTDAAASTILNSNVQVGGRNLLLGTADYSTKSSGNQTGISVSSDTYGGTRILVGAWSSGNMDMGRFQNAFSGSLRPDTDYTLSFWGKATASINVVSYLFSPSTVTSGVNSSGNTTTATDGAITTNLGTEWERYWVTWHTSTADSQATQIIAARVSGSGASGNTVYIAGIKFECGNKATDWTPAPEDVDDSILSVSKDINDQIEPINEGITNLTNDVTDHENRLATNEQAIANVQNMVNNLASTTSWLSFTAEQGLIIGDSASGDSYFYTQQKGSFMSFNQMSASGSTELMKLSGENGIEGPKVTVDEVNTDMVTIGDDWSITVSGDMFSINYIGS